MDITIIPALIAIFIIGVIFYFPVSMAKGRGRSKIGWFFLSFIFTPILTMIILFLLGDTKEMRLKKIQEEEEQRIAIRQKYSMENKD